MFCTQVSSLFRKYMVTVISMFLEWCATNFYWRKIPYAISSMKVYNIASALQFENFIFFNHQIFIRFLSQFIPMSDYDFWYLESVFNVWVGRCCKTYILMPCTNVNVADGTQLSWATRHLQCGDVYPMPTSHFILAFYASRFLLARSFSRNYTRVGSNPVSHKPIKLPQSHQIWCPKSSSLPSHIALQVKRIHHLTTSSFHVYSGQKII